MEKRISKEAIFQACIQRQTNLINNFTTEVEELEGEMTNHDHIASQSDHNPAAEQQTMHHVMKTELDFLKYEMNLLKRIDYKIENTVVEPGAVVVTDKRVFYISVSIEEVTVGEDKVFGLSTEAPIYAQMRGKKAGDAFEMNGMAYQILDVY